MDLARDSTGIEDIKMEQLFEMICFEEDDDDRRRTANRILSSFKWMEQICPAKETPHRQRLFYGSDYHKKLSPAVAQVLSDCNPKKHEENLKHLFPKLAEKGSIDKLIYMNRCWMIDYQKKFNVPNKDNSHVFLRTILESLDISDPDKIDLIAHLKNDVYSRDEYILLAQASSAFLGYPSIASKVVMVYHFLMNGIKFSVNPDRKGCEQTDEIAIDWSGADHLPPLYGNGEYLKEGLWKLASGQPRDGGPLPINAPPVFSSTIQGETRFNEIVTGGVWCTMLLMSGVKKASSVIECTADYRGMYGCPEFVVRKNGIVIYESMNVPIPHKVEKYTDFFKIMDEFDCVGKRPDYVKPIEGGWKWGYSAKYEEKAVEEAKELSKRLFEQQLARLKPGTGIYADYKKTYNQRSHVVVQETN